jgi:CheY-like chemotaxis protein
MHGNIFVNSEIGSGSTFVFTAELEMANENECLNEPTMAMMKLQPLLPAANTRILLAEDNPANQMVIKNILEFADRKWILSLTDVRQLRPCATCPTILF